MENWIALFSDLLVIVFDLLLYSRLVVLRSDNPKHRALLYAGCGAIVAFYALAVYALHWPVSVSALLCMTLPSLLLFWLFSSHRDARFLLTFCFVDTVSLVVGYISRLASLFLGSGGGLATLATLLVCFTAIYRLGSPYFKQYRQLLCSIDHGWKELTISAFFIYFTLIFTAAYPKPLIERTEYCVPYLVLCVTVLSFYVVFILSLLKTQKVQEQSAQLKEQQKWFHLAYVDALTGIPNRMAYMEKLHEVERTLPQLSGVAVAVFDLNDFKVINDTWGHACGDTILAQAAALLSHAFCGEEEAVYRIGGDEFAVISLRTDREQLLQKLDVLRSAQGDGISYSLSSGYSFADPAEKNAMEHAFSRADAMMYATKATHRRTGPL